MFARLTKFQLKMDRIDESVKLYRKSVIPAAKSQKGYCRIYLLVDNKTGKGATLSLWVSEEDAIANEENRFYQEQLVKFLNLLKEPSFIREEYEVKVQA